MSDVSSVSKRRLSREVRMPFVTAALLWANTLLLLWHSIYAIVSRTS